jgi:hypothetical protein
MDSRQREELIREFPVSLWAAGVLFAAGGVYAYFRSMPIGLTIGGAGIGLLLLLFSSVLIVELVDSRRTLLVRRIGLIRRKVDELPLSEIQAVFVQQSRNRDRDSNPSYRVVIAMQNGEIYPLRNYYSGGALRKEKAAQQLREAIGVGGHDQTAMGAIEMASQLVQGSYEVGGRTLDEMDMQETNGVRWQMQTISFGASPVIRWLSKDFAYPDQFLYLAQKVEGQDSGKKAMALMGKTLMRQSLRMYGFDDADVPNFKHATELVTDDLGFGEHFFAYASDDASARGLITAWVVRPLERWAERHPMVQGINQRENFNQLVVLYSPKGVYVCCLGELDEIETEQLVALGVELVKAQGG